MNLIIRILLLTGISSFIFVVFKDIGFSMIFNIDAFLIVIGGTAIALLVGFPLKRIRNAVKDVINSYAESRNREHITEEIVDIARMHMKTSIRNIESKMESIDDEFMKLGVRLLINDYSSYEIKNIMEREMMIRTINRNFSQNMLRTIARLTPSFGLAGTVISLIKMFKSLDSIEAIAPMMAVALMSTFYGVIIANLVMLPLCAKLKEKSIESETTMAITIDGILAINNMEHPLKIEERLKGYKDHKPELAFTGNTVTSPSLSGVFR